MAAIATMIEVRARLKWKVSMKGNYLGGWPCRKRLTDIEKCPESKEKCHHK